MPARSHGESKTQLYNAWQNMKARCYRKSAREFENYGGRGITVCDEWKNDYKSFRTWAFDNGYIANLPHGEMTLDRINVNGNYEPSNCRWISNKKQQNNKRYNATYEYKGETFTLAEWSEKLGICYKTLQKRIDKWGVERAFSEPLHKEPYKDMVGEKHGRLTCIDFVRIGKNGAEFLFRCECGNNVVARGSLVRNGNIISCGCYNREFLSKWSSENTSRLAKERASKRKIKCFSKDGLIIGIFEGTENASTSLGVRRNTIQRALKTKTHYGGGYYWEDIE